MSETETINTLVLTDEEKHLVETYRTATAAARDAAQIILTNGHVYKVGEQPLQDTIVWNEAGKKFIETFKRKHTYQPNELYTDYYYHGKFLAAAHSDQTEIGKALHYISKDVSAPITQEKILFSLGEAFDLGVYCHKKHKNLLKE